MSAVKVKPKMMGVTEVCKVLGTVSSNLDKIPGLPEPYQHLAGGRIWEADVIREFAKERTARRRAVERKRQAKHRGRKVAA